MNEISAFEKLRLALSDRSAIAGVIGLGYVGLPLSMAIARASFRVIGFDVDSTKPPRLNAGEPYIGGVSGGELARHVHGGRFAATDDFNRLGECDVIVICVPTPLTRQRQPDLSYVVSSAKQIAARLRRAQLVILESTTYPGTTREIVLPILEAAGFAAGRDFFLGYSPEREDPGNEVFETASIPKLVAGLGDEASRLVQAFYGAVVTQIVPVSSLEVAEAAKLTENVFRAVNIALANELKTVFGAMGIDAWEVIEAAKTKPFGYMPFYPGPGLGGHCVPVDPFYLSWKAQQSNVAARFIELAGEINHAMPDYVVGVLADALQTRRGKALAGARILLLGLAYKKNVPDVRESPSFELLKLLEERGANVDFHDPHVMVIPQTRDRPEFRGKRSIALDAGRLAGCDAVLIATDHDAVDYALIAEHARLIVDTRNVMARKGLASDHVVKA